MQRLTAGWILLASLLLAGPAAQGATLTWPGAAPCDTTLQACIDAAGSGDSIEIATNGPVAESLLTVSRSLNLRPATGFTPVIAGSVLLDGTAAAADFTVESLTAQGIEALAGPDGITVLISGNHVTLTDNFAVGIQIDSINETGKIAGKIAGNQISVTGSDANAGCAGIIVGPAADGGSVPFNVVGNTVSATNCLNGWGIFVENGNGVPLTADVVGNVVTASGTNNGIFFFNAADTSGSLLTVRAINNVVSGAVDIGGVPGGLAVDTNSEPVSAVLVNNTVVGNQTGLLITGRPDLGGTITGGIANNIVANNPGIGIEVDPGFAITNHHNLVHGNGSDLFTPGPGTIDADPQFASASFELGPSSPAINAGDNAVLPPGFNTDILNLPRIVGGVVDMGAFEVQVAAPIIAVPALSTYGAALLVLLLAAFALWRLRLADGRSGS